VSEKPQPRADERSLEPEAEEHAGELTVERLRKDDGRALIAYWRERPER
jgi:hypothetical protein